MLFNVIHYTKLEKRLINIKKLCDSANIDIEIISSFDKEKIPETLIQRIDTNKISLSEASCFFKHIEIYKRLSENTNAKYSIVIEDDVVFSSDISDNLTKCISKLPDNFDLFFFGKSKINFKVPFYKKNIFKKDNYKSNWGGNGVTRTLDSYVISKKCADIIYREFLDLDFVDDAVDAWINNLARKFKFNGYWLKRPLTFNNEKFKSSLESTRWYD